MRPFAALLRSIGRLPLRRQLMWAFATLSIGATGFTAITVASLASHRMQRSLGEKSVQYARQMQKQLQPVIAFNDHVTAQEAFESLMGDRDVDGLGVYRDDGEQLEGAGYRPTELKSINAPLQADPHHVIAVAEIQAREGRKGRVFVRLTSQSIDEMAHRNALFASAIAGGVALCALLLAVKISQRIARRLERIGEAAKRMAAGDDEFVEIRDSGQDSIGALARAFDTMALELDRLSTEHEHLVATERERLEQLVCERTQALEQSREMFRLIAESTHAVPFTLDLLRGSFPYIGAQAIALFQIPEERWGRPGALELALPLATHAQLRGTLDDCASGCFEFLAEIQLPDDTRAEVRWTGTCEITGGHKLLRGLMLDVTEIRRLARDLAAAQKLESVGRLAAGVAHEINTPVQFVSDNVEFVSGAMASVTAVIRGYRELRAAVQMTVDAETAAAARAAAAAESREDIEYILENIPPALSGATEGLRRIATIVRSMKDFAHPDQSSKSAADLNRAIQSTLVVARNEYKYVAKLETDFQELPPVHCYLGEINQVVLNLLINAAHAIGDVVKDTGAMGTLTIRTRRLGDEVEIAIGDTGTGIPPDVREKIFDPFFTTKEVGRGTGQGLAIARSVVVNKHGGTLSFDTETARGTTFYIRLPLGATNPAAAMAA